MTKTRDLADLGGGFIQTGTGAVQRTVEGKLQDTVSVKDFGAVGDGVTNDSPAFNAAILHVTLQGGGRVIAPSDTYLLTSTIILPSDVELDLCKSAITGPGVGSATDLFQTGYVSGGALVSNTGGPAESHLVTGCSVKNGTISNCGKAFNLYNFIDNCEISNIKFNNCAYALYVRRSWYGRFVNLFSRGSANNAANAAFYFADFVNVCQIESVFAEGRVLGIEVASGANGQKLLTCSAESCTNGIIVSGETGPIQFDTCYLENISGVAIDLQNYGYKYDVSVDNCWFQSCGTAIRSENSGAGAELYVSENNRFVSCTTIVDASDNVFNYGKVEIPPALSSGNNTGPTLPAGYSLGSKSRVEHEHLIYNNSSGLPIVKTKVHGTTLIAFEHEGDPGSYPSNCVPFCSHAKTAGTTFSINIDTKIAYRAFNSHLLYRLQVVDNNGTYQIFGLIFGDQVWRGDATGKTVTVSSNNGFTRITVGTFSHPAEYYNLEGIVRHV